MNRNIFMLLVALLASGCSSAAKKPTLPVPTLLTSELVFFPSPVRQFVIITDAPRPDWTIESVVIAGDTSRDHPPVLRVHALKPRSELFRGCSTTGRALLRLDVDTRGYVWKVTVSRTSGCASADAAMVEDASAWVCVPAIKQGLLASEPVFTLMPTELDE